MKFFMFGMLLLSFVLSQAQAQPQPGPRPPHHMSEELKACFSEVKAGGSLSEACQELMKKEDDRRAKIEACIQQIDAADSSDDSTTDATDTTDAADTSASEE